jgi:hypothetical protein
MVARRQTPEVARDPLSEIERITPIEFEALDEALKAA